MGKFVLQQLRAAPNIYLIENFLSTTEVEYLRQRADQGRFQKSYCDAVQADGKQTSVLDQQHRTSTFLSLKRQDDQKIATIERRACALLNVWNPDAVEPLQLVRYGPGQFFRMHHDLGDFNAATGTVALPPRMWHVQRRLVTIFCYLNEPTAGGETFFPQAAQLKVQPTTGSAVLFCNVTLDEQSPERLIPDPRTVHEAKPVREGTKYGLNIWICEAG